ncbi:MAG: ATP-dependent protease LonB [Clostridium sp.]|nr:ATP-dependent protease LonB [Clostridium sp.]
MTELIIVLQIILMVLMIYVILSNNNVRANKVIIDKENKKEMNHLNNMKKLSLTIPLTEKSRPQKFEEVIGQENGIKALKAALCGANPQHVIIYGPPGVGKTAAARLVLEEAIKSEKSPFTKEAKFVEIDATTLRFDDRGIADPLIGSVHDPIYQGAGAMGLAGIPQPKEGAVTKAHGGMLFIDEIGELHPTELNKLLKVLEDRKVFLDSSYYSSEDPNIPLYIKEIFEKGLPADFRLIAATTRSPEEILPAIRSRCVEIFFKALTDKEIIKIAREAVKKIQLEIQESALELVGKFCVNGREAVNLVQLAAGIAINEDRKVITNRDIKWSIENGRYNKKLNIKINDSPEIGIVNGLAIYGDSIGTIMKIEASIKKIDNREGRIKISGIVEEEILSRNNKKIKRKSTALSSVENVVTVLNNIYNLNLGEYDIHVNIPGGIPVDGPSAGIAIATVIYSAIKEKAVDNTVAMTGEIGLLGGVKAVGGIKEKIEGAKRAGAQEVIIPKENFTESLLEVEGINIIPVENISEVFNCVFIEEEQNNFNSINILLADKKAK